MDTTSTYSNGHNDPHVHMGFSEAKHIGQSLPQDLENLRKNLSSRAKLEVDNTLNDLRLKIFSGLATTLAITYAIFWFFAASVVWFSPTVPLEYSLSVIAGFHIVLAAILYFYAKRPLPLDEELLSAREKSESEIKNVFHQLSVKTHEIKKIANESLNPLTQVKRNPEAFLVGSFFLGIALSLLAPSAKDGASQTLRN